MAYFGGAGGVGSLNEIQQIRAELEQIRAIVTELEPKLEKAPRQLATFRELERVALRYLVLAKRMGLPEDVDRAINFITRLVVVARQAQISLSLLMTTNPVTVALGIAGLAMSAISLTDSFSGY